jgi:opacity protein-like surface antigen
MFRNTTGATAFTITMTTLAILAGLSLMMALTATKARAQTVSAYAGVHAGYSIASTEIAIPGVALDGVGSKGLLGGVHGGVDIFLPNSPWFVGAWAAYDWSRVDAKLSAPPVFSASARLGDAWSVGGRLGLSIGKVSPYAVLGYKQQETGLSLAGVGMPTLKGIVYGAGADYAVAQNLKIGALATLTKFDAADVGGVPGLTIKPEALEVTLRASLSFGGPVATSATPLK